MSWIHNISSCVTIFPLTHWTELISFEFTREIFARQGKPPEKKETPSAQIALKMMMNDDEFVAQFTFATHDIIFASSYYEPMFCSRRWKYEVFSFKMLRGKHFHSVANHLSHIPSTKPRQCWETWEQEGGEWVAMGWLRWIQIHGTKSLAWDDSFR